eukprot:maker-scaffold1023_size69924-snap-gene-0.17 protein:Tk02665 transcript:maker-scaffold1023_size69924-snap-gene-0.17-mRNA-1 annotation:"zinc finger and scan domain-containing protein 2 isoform x3"
MALTSAPDRSRRAMELPRACPAFEAEALASRLEPIGHKLDLVSWLSGRWLVWLRRHFDCFVRQEPYLVTFLFLDLHSGQLIVRSLGRGVAKVICTTPDEIEAQLVDHFQRQAPCLGRGHPAAADLSEVTFAPACPAFCSLSADGPACAHCAHCAPEDDSDTEGPDPEAARWAFPLRPDSDEDPAGSERMTPSPDASSVPTTFECEPCEKRYRLYSTFYRHNVRHHGHGQFQCLSCATPCSSVDELVTHVREAHPEQPRVACAACPLEFDLDPAPTDPVELTTHYAQCVSARVNRKAGQWRARAQKRTGQALKSHQCDLCGETFTNNFLLKNHRIQKHTKDFPFNCPDCGYGTVWKQAFDMHRKTHLREQGFLEDETKEALWFFCEKCGHKFSTRDSLKYHVLKVHEKVQERLQCKDCDKVFANRVRLSRHRIIEHSTDPKYQCDICGYRGTGTDLKIHRKSHEAPQYNCKYCGKGIKSQSSLICHERIHTGENPFKCPFCDYTCKSSATLCLHKKFIHNDGKNLTEFPLPEHETDT